jgi:5-methylcytosine-specific restriction enzyme A
MPSTGELLTVTQDMLHAQVQTSMRAWDIQSNPKVESDAPMYEGLLKTVTLTFTERNPKARAACIAEHGCSCAVCEMNFEKTYGSVGKDYIQVHHIEPLAYANGMREVDPATDLIPICPNCHAMVHRTDPPISISGLRTLLISR